MDEEIENNTRFKEIENSIRPIDWDKIDKGDRKEKERVLAFLKIIYKK